MLGILKPTVAQYLLDHPQYNTPAYVVTDNLGNVSSPKIQFAIDTSYVSYPNIGLLAIADQDFALSLAICHELEVNMEIECGYSFFASNVGSRNDTISYKDSPFSLKNTVCGAKLNRLLKSAGRGTFVGAPGNMCRQVPMYFGSTYNGQ